jgi:hypothetical protein
VWFTPDSPGDVFFVSENVVPPYRTRRLRGECVETEWLEECDGAQWAEAQGTTGKGLWFSPYNDETKTTDSTPSRFQSSFS